MLLHIIKARWRYYSQANVGHCDGRGFHHDEEVCPSTLVVFGGFREQRLQFRLAGWLWQEERAEDRGVQDLGEGNMITMRYIPTICPRCRWRANLVWLLRQLR